MISARRASYTADSWRQLLVNAVALGSGCSCCWCEIVDAGCPPMDLSVAAGITEPSVESRSAGCGFWRVSVAPRVVCWKAIAGRLHF